MTNGQISELETQKVQLPTQKPFRAGVLKEHFEEWSEITTDPSCLENIQGVIIPLERQPPLSRPRRKDLNEIRTDPVIDESVKELLELGVIHEIPVTKEVFLSRVFTVPKVERGVEYARRFIINLKVSYLTFMRSNLFAEC